MSALFKVAFCLIPSFRAFPRYCLNDFEIVLVAPIITGIILVFTYHMGYIYYYSYYYWRKSSFDRLLGSQLRIPLRVRMFASCVRCVGSCLCEELLTG